MIFFWYSQVTETAFSAGVGFIEKTFINLHGLFVLESRGAGGALLGKGIMEKGIPHMIEFVFTWLTFALIGIGIIALIRRYKEMSFPELEFKKPEFLKDKFEVEYFVLALACAGLLVVVIGLPFVAVGYGLDRMYPLAITILSVFFVIGGIILSKHFFFLKKKTCAKRKSIDQTASHNSFRKRGDEENVEVRAYLIILLVLIPYFLCVTGVTYQMFGYHGTIILNSEGKQYDKYYVHDQESYGARWLANNAEQKNIRIYTDRVGDRRLISHAGFSPHTIDKYTLTDERDIEIKGYFYLRYYNVVDGKLLDWQFEEHNITEYSDKFTGKSKLYNNGGAEIWE
jgi:uncharacterized membrane protein